MNPLLKERHEVAIELLQRLSLDNVVLELKGRDYLWRACTASAPTAHNGHATAKCGKLRIRLR